MNMGAGRGALKGALPLGFTKYVGWKFESMLMFTDKIVLRDKSDSRSLRNTEVKDVLVIPDSQY